MTSENILREKLRKIEALFAGAGTAGETKDDAAEYPIGHNETRVTFEAGDVRNLRVSQSTQQTEATARNGTEEKPQKAQIRSYVLSTQVLIARS